MSVARLVSVLALGCVLVTGCGPALPPAGNYATVSGRISDSLTGAGLAGAMVVVNSVLSATTDSAGSYRIVTVPTGPWSYSVAGPATYGIVNSTNPTPLAPGEARTLDISLAHR